LLGPGQVGQALLTLLAHTPHRVIAVSDSTATIHEPNGIDIPALLASKLRGEPLRGQLRANRIPTFDAVKAVAAPVVVDTTPTRFDRAQWPNLGDLVLARGDRLVLASKDALCTSVDRWLGPTSGARVGFNAVLGGTGKRLRDELPWLSQACDRFALAGNASTTTILKCIERGGELEDGLRAAEEAGVLEPDPSLDLRGVDAAVKLAIVAGAIGGRPIAPEDVAAEDLRDLDFELVRSRARRGRTTRLVGRWCSEAGPRLCYEEVEVGDPLCVPADRVAYVYHCVDGSTRLHVGAGLGAQGTAQALLEDINAWQ